MQNSKNTNNKELAKYIRDIPDFPKDGIIFKDITPLLENKKAFKKAIEKIVAEYKDKKIDKVVAIDARGFLIGSPVAFNLGAGIAIVRKKGKLPYKTHSVEYDLEYGKDIVEMHQDAIKPGENILIVDDLLATGGTVNGVIELVEKLKGKIIGIAFLIELTFLKGGEKINKYPIYSLIKY